MSSCKYSLYRMNQDGKCEARNELNDMFCSSLASLGSIPLVVSLFLFILCSFGSPISNGGSLFPYQVGRFMRTPFFEFGRCYKTNTRRDEIENRKEKRKQSNISLLILLNYQEVTMDITISNTTYRFPILKNAEIIECLSEAGIELNETELTEPNRHKEKVKQVFLSLVSTTRVYIHISSKFNSILIVYISISIIGGTRSRPQSRIILSDTNL